MACDFVLDFVCGPSVVTHKQQTSNGIPMFLFFLEKCLREAMCITRKLQKQGRFFAELQKGKKTNCEDVYSLATCTQVLTDSGYGDEASLNDIILEVSF